MIGIWSEFSQTYLLYFFVFTTVAFSIPIFFFPLAWARLMRWSIPEDTDLVLYFGRCLGSFALVIAYFIYQAAATGFGELLIFQILISFSAIMVGLHIYGALKHIQPITETLEIGLWTLLFFLSLAFYPGA
ncbi:MAG: hypothetical protein AB2686_11660 [Candidatus Thiodiazotropha sp.]